MVYLGIWCLDYYFKTFDIFSHINGTDKNYPDFLRDAEIASIKVNFINEKNLAPILCTQNFLNEWTAFSKASN